MNKILALLAALLLCPAFVSAQPSVWTVNSLPDVLKGDADGVSIADNGTITLAPQAREVFSTEQPYIWSSIADAAGSVYLGTGSDGRIFRVTPSGTGSLFADLAELNVTALAIGRGGEIFAGTSPDGKVYRIDANGKAEAYFAPAEKYIWSLAVMADGSLAVGTGESGKIFRVRSANAAPAASLLFDTSETHIITLAADTKGNLYAGTDSNGLVLRFGSDGRPFALLDSPLREIHEIALGTDGSIYALAIGESTASSSDTKPAPSATPETKTAAPSRNAQAAAAPPQKSRYDLSGARSAVYRIVPDGGSDILWASTTVSGFSILAQNGGRGVLLGTSDKGRIYSIDHEGRSTLVLQTDADQISTITAHGGSVYATSSNLGRLFRFGAEPLAEGSYRSSVLDAGSTADWGRIWWNGAGGVQLETRSGNTENADETWSPWANVSGTLSGQIASPPARFMQWRAVLKRSSSPPELREVNVAFLPRNIAPEVLSITVLPTNVGLIANPPVQIDPNIELSGLDPAAFGIPNANVPPRRVYQRSARSVQWAAEDRNGDKIVYDVMFKEAGETAYKALAENVRDTFYTIDGQALADGRYTIKIVAKDSPSNPAGRVLTGERTSEPFDIDNGQPIVTLAGTPAVTDGRARIVFTASEKAGYIARAEYSVNGGEWAAVLADDGISDGPEEKYTLSVSLPAAGEYTITLRVFDANGNAGNARAIVTRR